MPSALVMRLISVLCLAGAIVAGAAYVRHIRAKNDRLEAANKALAIGIKQEKDNFSGYAADVHAAGESVAKLIKDKDDIQARTNSALARARSVPSLSSYERPLAPTSGPGQPGDNEAGGCGLSERDRKDLEGSLDKAKADSIALSGRANEVKVQLQACQAELGRRVKAYQ
jgi:hypothetical protein